MKTTLAACSSAEICRQNEWYAGAVLQSVGAAPEYAGQRPERTLCIRITAVGRRRILAELVSIDLLDVDGQFDEEIVILHFRDWHKV